MHKRLGQAGLLVFLAVGLVGGCGPEGPRGQAPPVDGGPADPFAVVAEMDRLATLDLWPGFDPAAVPVAIFDGDRTLLFRHPAPPEGFHPLEDRPEAWAHPGRHGAVTANTSVELGGIGTATLLMDPGDLSVRRYAGILVHETFHVLQRERHPGWSADEMELFTYPVDDVELLSLRRPETEALRRALVSDQASESACWARLALSLRGERFIQLPPGAAGYERGSELNEGLASYVEHLALGQPDGELIPPRGFPPEAVRQRSYRTGTALARLLDRFDPRWRETLSADDSLSLDALLMDALPVESPEPGQDHRDRDCAFSTREEEAFRESAADDLRTLREARGERREAFLQAPGWRIVVIAGGAPLLPSEFDPLNVEVVADGEVLHSRLLHLGSDAGSLEVLGRSALTEAVGPHPLFNGIRTVTIGGIPNEPEVTGDGDGWRIRAEGVQGHFQPASIHRDASTVTVTLRP